jgi:hypothetical protein
LGLALEAGKGAIGFFLVFFVFFPERSEQTMIWYRIIDKRCFSLSLIVLVICVFSCVVLCSDKTEASSGSAGAKPLMDQKTKCKGLIDQVQNRS